MKKLAVVLTLPLALGLAACDTLGVPKLDVSGNILGTKPSGTVRLTLRGTTVNGWQTPVLDQINIPTFNPEKSAYAISLPEKPSDGAYELLAYADTGATANRYDEGETRTQVTGKVFIYAKDGLGDKSAKDCLNVKAGWSLCDTATMKVDQSGTPFDYDMTW
ncbi:MULTISPECIES: hypothetical protein [Deinococcus]|jgi:hypothetical protein|uniref:DUF2141 domain-containing protein n=2 Tax=Deinococcus TaxID=1298 RepID=A0A221SY22_9DEIO|nr:MULTISPECIES: hypothetical protein [Deinococcus]ASN81496.1 hypothetical protein DFI_11245 [Deinococcus ficus]MDP9766355.1 hypothetical protein [Deinococcus enclensis]